jgi:hypothetical protein
MIPTTTSYSFQNITSPSKKKNGSNWWNFK